MSSNQHVFIAIFGREQPGIVSGVTGVLLDCGCNIRDSNMSLLGGVFTMMLMVEAPPGTGPLDLERALWPVKRRLQLTVAVSSLDPELTVTVRPNKDRLCAITIYGGEGKGMVHQITSVLARKGITIHELKTRVLGTVQGAGFMTLRVLVPPGVDMGELRRQLQDTAVRFGVELSLGG